MYPFGLLIRVLLSCNICSRSPSRHMSQVASGGPLRARAMAALYCVYAGDSFASYQVSCGNMTHFKPIFQQVHSSKQFFLPSDKAFVKNYTLFQGTMLLHPRHGLGTGM